MNVNTESNMNLLMLSSIFGILQLISSSHIRYLSQLHPHCLLVMLYALYTPSFVFENDDRLYII